MGDMNKLVAERDAAAGPLVVSATNPATSRLDQPGDAADPFTVSLAAGSYRVDWYSLDTRKTEAAGEVTAERTSTVSFAAPFEPGTAVLP